MTISRYLEWFIGSFRVDGWVSFSLILLTLAVIPAVLCVYAWKKL